VIRIRAMTAEDVPVVLHLRELAGWNQREADVRRLLDLEPDGCFLAEWAGRPAGTATTCVFGPVAWVAMVLVEPALRGRGIGTALMEHALAYLDRRQVPTVRLDATPLGQPIYEKLGFVTEYRLARYQGKLPAGEPLAQLEPVRPEQLEEVARLDREVTSTDRRKLLFRLFEERPGEMRMVRRDGRVAGFISARPGERAVQVGPCLADAEAGPLLLADACRRHAGEAVFLDIPEDNRPATALAAEWGLTVQRHLLRMVRGVPIREDVGQLWASSGPEKG
jgi:GNAT superfamily N-acetyltransferase